MRPACALPRSPDLKGSGRGAVLIALGHCRSQGHHPGLEDHQGGQKHVKPLGPLCCFLCFGKKGGCEFVFLGEGWGRFAFFVSLFWEEGGDLEEGGGAGASDLFPLVLWIWGRGFLFLGFGGEEDKICFFCLLDFLSEYGREGGEVRGSGAAFQRRLERLTTRSAAKVSLYRLFLIMFLCGVS